MRLPDPLIAALLTVTLGLPAAAIAADGPDTAELGAQLRATEEAFARTMADRDHAAFVSFLAEDAVFFGRAGELRGREAVAAAWKPLYEGAVAPFSWQPEVATVLDWAPSASPPDRSSRRTAAASAPSPRCGGASPTAAGRSSSTAAAPTASARRRPLPPSDGSLREAAAVEEGEAAVDDVDRLKLARDHAPCRVEILEAQLVPAGEGAGGRLPAGRARSASSGCRRAR